MEKYLLKYLNTEKQAARILLAVGTVTTVFGIVSVFQYPDLIWFGLGVSIFLLGLFELAIGLVRHMSSFRQYEAFKALMRDFPQQFIRSEQKRLSNLLEYLHRKRKVELLLLVLGIGLAITGGVFSPNDLSLGLGIGLSIQAAVLLIDSLIHQWRAGLFQHEIRRFSSE